MANEMASMSSQISDAVGALETLSATIQSIGSQMNEVLLAVGQSMSESLNGIIASMETIVNQSTIAQDAFMNLWVTDNAISFTDVVGGLVTGLGVLGTTLGIVTSLMKIFGVESANAAISLAVETAATWAQKAANEASAIAQAALNFVMNLNPFVLIATLIAGVVAVLITLWNTNDGFREALTSAWEAISSAFSACWDAIVSFFTETIPAAVQAANEQFLAFSEFLSGIWSAVGEFFSACWDGIVAFFTETLPGIINDMITWFSELPGKIGEYLNQMINFFAELPDRIWSFLCNVVNNVISWAANLLSTAKTEIPKFIASVATYFNELPGKVLETGKNLVRGLWNGISETGEWLWSKLTGWCNGILDKIKGLFGIHSPSTVMSDVIGKNLALGVAEGISENGDTVTEAFDGVLDEMEAAAESRNAANLSMDADGALAVTPQLEEEQNPAERIRAMMEEAGRTIPEGFFTIGDLSAAQFGKAFEARLQAIFEQARMRIAEFQQRVVVQFISEAEAAVERANQIINNTGNTYHNNYTITAANTSPKATADAIQKQMTMQRMLFA